jgi:type I restriction-modification system DNA methylase subunit
MTARYKPLLDRDFLKRELYYEYLDFAQSAADGVLLERLGAWDERRRRGEREIEAGFIQRFFVETWGYRDAGGGTAEWTMQQQFPVPGAGVGGGVGAADLALGDFGRPDAVGQVLCEFKGVGADLDRPQRRKGDTRSPAQQALDYLRHARRPFFGTEPALPRFALVTDMNTFRLYWYDRAPERYLQFRISGGNLLDIADGATTMLSDNEEARFDRFLFATLFRPDMLLSSFGRTRIEQLIQRQGTREKKLEKDFYSEYRDYRLRLRDAIRLDPSTAAMSDGDVLRLAQKVLDRLIFVMFAEDMGMRVAFPPNLLRDVLKTESLHPFYDAQGTNIWRNMQSLFSLMDRGGALQGKRIHRFNGGLFEADPRIDALALPNMLFCTAEQGRNDPSIEAEKATLLYFAAAYNFAAEGDAKNSIGLYTLGHIFEQSIDDLEAEEAQAEGARIGKRKREGVYYTPEPIVRRVVEETVGPLLARWRAEAGWPDAGEPDAAAARAYWERLSRISVLDPACGSGAFLIVALRYLLAEFRTAHETLRALDPSVALRDEPQLIDDILCNNLHGIDINPTAVEIAQLSLWLHTARAERPLSQLAERVVAGNSLIGPEFNEWPGARDLPDAVRERVRSFDWRAAFPTVAARGGFDAVIGNPPYVKLQNLQRYRETVRYLKSGAAGYETTQTGNFDIFLPFIERGLAMLNGDGRLGYIAPNLWPKLDYGEALRKLVARGRHLERWLDFRSHQVFEGLSTYTAIQIFTRAPNEAIRVGFAPTGEMAKVDWRERGGRIPYEELAAAGAPWLFAPEPVRRLTERLAGECRKLGDRDVTRGIIVGIQTSADHIYHLERLGPGRYLHQPPTVNKVKPPAVEVAIEDAIMKPLVSGAEAKRFIDPATRTYLLFPYCVDETGARLWTPEEMAQQFPLAWAYLRSFEEELRKRDSGKNNDDERWFGYVYPKNLDKQETVKLLVPRLVSGLKLAMDPAQEFYCDNVDVGGVVPADPAELPFLAGILGSPTPNLLFKWGSKPFRGDYLSANKQFIAPLPVPHANDDERAAVAATAEALQRGYSRRAKVVVMLDDRLAATGRRPLPYEALLPKVRPIAEIERTKPRSMPPGDVRDWANARYKEQIDAELARVNSAIRLDSVLDAVLDEGELKLLVDEQPVARMFVAAEAADFLLAQWQVVALRFEPTGKEDGKRLIDRLRLIAFEADGPLRAQIVERQGELSALTAELRELERRLDDQTAALFRLTPEERALVRRG